MVPIGAQLASIIWRRRLGELYGLAMDDTGAGLTSLGDGWCPTIHQSDKTASIRVPRGLAVHRADIEWLQSEKRKSKQILGSFTRTPLTHHRSAGA